MVCPARLLSAMPIRRRTGYRDQLRATALRDELRSCTHTVHQRLANEKHVVVSMNFKALESSTLPLERLQLAAVYIVLAIHRSPRVRQYGVVALADFGGARYVMSKE